MPLDCPDEDPLWPDGELGDDGELLWEPEEPEELGALGGLEG